MATNTQIKTGIDTDITNKTLPKSVLNTNVGIRMKSIVDYVDQQIATVSTASFKELRGVLTQSGTNAPVITTFKNDFTGAITLTRVNAGIYNISIAGLTSSDYLNKAFCIIGSTNNPASSRSEMIITTDGGSNYFFTVYTISVPGNLASDSLLTRTSFQIKVQN